MLQASPKWFKMEKFCDALPGAAERDEPGGCARTYRLPRLWLEARTRRSDGSVLTWL